MEAAIVPQAIGGVVEAVSSKSMAHRLLILAALANKPCEFVCNTTSEDIAATARCLDALSTAHPVELDCGESGSTLRFLLPVACALGIPCRFVCHGRLAERPLAPLDTQLEAHGAHVAREGNRVDVFGQLCGGTFSLPGDVSSQFATGLLLAATVLDDPTEVLVSTPIQSRPYIDLTIHALRQFGQEVSIDKIVREGSSYERFYVEPAGLASPAHCVVEGDWSNAAFWLAAGALEAEGITVAGLDLTSPQGDRSVLAALAAFGARIARKGNAARATRDAMHAAELDVRAIPDLVPPLAAVATLVPGTSRFTHAERLRMKESDRLAAIVDVITSFGGRAWTEGDDLVIEGVHPLAGATIDAHNDHRICMMAAILATHASGTTTITDAMCVNKSYPTFWDDYARLGGTVALTDNNEE